MVEDRWRSFTIADLAPISRLGINLISLQKDATTDEILQLAQLGIAHHVGGLLDDFSQTAACLQQLELLITPDTAVAHIAGALGVPVCLALYQLGDWRWGTTATTPWYPSITIFRQKRLGQWQPVMAQIAQYLQNQLVIDEQLVAKRYFTIAYASTQQNAWHTAIRFYQQAIHASPLWVEPHYHIAVCYQQLRNYPQATAHYVTAMSLNPEHSLLRYHAAKCLKDSHQLDAALPLYQQAIQANPHHPDMQYSLGLCYLLKGDWLKAWPLYEQRFYGSDRAGKDQANSLNLPKLNPAQIQPNTAVIITCEQGMGDAILCLRYLPYLKHHIQKICWIVHHPLLSFFRQYQNEHVRFIPWTTDPVGTTDYTHQFPMLSLPGAFNTTPDKLPNAPYLQADTHKVQQWQQTLNSLSPNKKRIGLVWQGGKVSTANGRDVHYRSLTVLLNDPQLNQHIHWYSLQKDSAPPENSNIINLMHEVQDFTDTAAFITNLDLVISVDTSVAHLAGALGKPVWLLNRYESEWRWMLGKTNTPWYPSMRLFNQKQIDDWQPLLEQLTQTLKTELPMVKAKIVFALYDPNGTYWPYTAVAIQSLVQSASCPVEIAILHESSLHPNAHTNLSELANDIGCELQWLRLDFDNPVDPDVLRQFTPASIYRLFIPQIFEQDELIIYLDSDLVVNGLDIADLVQSVPDDVALAAVKDPYIAIPPVHQTSLKYFGIEAGQYVNSGVLAMRPHLMPKNLFSQFLDFMKKVGRCPHPDQDFLNYIFKNKIHYLEARFNFQACPMQGSLLFPLAEYDNKIVHYVGKVKPLHGGLSVGMLPFWMYAKAIKGLMDFLPIGGDI